MGANVRPAGVQRAAAERTLQQAVLVISVSLWSVAGIHPRPGCTLATENPEPGPSDMTAINAPSRSGPRG